LSSERHNVGPEEANFCGINGRTKVVVQKKGRERGGESYWSKLGMHGLDDGHGLSDHKCCVGGGGGVITKPKREERFGLLQVAVLKLQKEKAKRIKVSRGERLIGGKQRTSRIIWGTREKCWVQDWGMLQKKADIKKEKM